MAEEKKVTIKKAVVEDILKTGAAEKVVPEPLDFDDETTHIDKEEKGVIKPTVGDSGIVHIERQYKITKEGKEFATEVLKTPVMRFAVTPARVSVKYGVTLNMGNYESSRVDVLVEVPCYKEDIDEVFSMIADYTEDLVSQHIDQIKGVDKEKPEEEVEDDPFK
jgi:hypothetical protein